MHSLRLSDTLFLRKLSQVQRHVSAYRTLGVPPTLPFTALELGTGWYPIVPVGLVLCGAARVLTIDLRPLLSGERTRAVLQAYLRLHEDGRLPDLLPAADEARVSWMANALEAAATSAPEDVLRTMKVGALVGDARATGLARRSVDLIVSNNTLEHVPPDVLEDLFREFRRIIRVGGVMSHAIDLGDHYSLFDHALSPYNFLRYSDSTWRWFNNGFLYQNRFRLSDYRELHERTGFAIAQETGQASRPERLKEVALAARFQRYSEEDLVVTSGWMASRPDDG